MKKLILIIPISLLFSCEKTYECKIVTQGLDNPYYYTFKGTHKEMKEFEANHGVNQTIDCK